MKKGMNKLGELTSRQIVLIVLVIAGLIIGIVFFALFFEDMPDKEVCRLSVVERASLPVGKEAIPLKCTTEKTCITTKKSDKCKEFTGEENIRYVELKISTDNEAKDIAGRKAAIKKIEEETANAMFDCWKMTGEGKLNIFGSESFAGALVKSVKEEWNLEDVKPKCIVCSRIAISDSVRDKDRELIKKYDDSADSVGNKNTDYLFLSTMDVNRYMVTNNVPGSTLTYLETFTDEGVGGYSEFSKEEASSKKKVENDVSQLAIVFTQIKVSNEVPKEEYWSAFNTGVAVGGVTALTGPGRIITRSVGPIGWIIEAAAVGAASHSFASKVEDTLANNQLIATSVCGKYATDEKGRKKYGCSLTKAMKWEEKEINKLCSGGFEGNF